MRSVGPEQGPIETPGDGWDDTSSASLSPPQATIPNAAPTLHMTATAPTRQRFEAPTFSLPRSGRRPPPAVLSQMNRIPLADLE